MEILKTVDLKKYYGSGENQVKALDGGESFCGGRRVCISGWNKRFRKKVRFFTC